ncbi:MAG: hypothetical protein H7A15_05105 [Sinobacteraceae bacterium]|nr:hypothetical protein [Nevskiaceae bacterium]
MNAAASMVTLAHAVRTGLEHHTVLANPQAVLLPVLVLADGAQQAGPQRQAHDCEIAGDRVGERRALELWVQPLLQGGIDEREADDLVVAARAASASSTRCSSIAVSERGRRFWVRVGAASGIVS